MSQQSPEKSAHSLDEWDAEIEAEFQRTVAAGKNDDRSNAASGRKKWERVLTQVPRAWEIRLQKTSRVSTYKLALELLYANWRAQGGPIIVTSRIAKAAAISDRSKWRALAELERLGLIEIARGTRKSPRVTLRHLPHRPGAGT